MNCSFGEIVDKVSILNLKTKYARDNVTLEHIETEKNTIIMENPMVEQEDVLFTELSIVNQTLWNLENNIRDKSMKKEFDQQYIDYAEQIHIQNDTRYNLKRQINEKYNSFLKEQKIYTIQLDIKDLKKLEIGKQLYTSGNYKHSLSCIQSLMDKYKQYDKVDTFYIDLLFSYTTVCRIYNHSHSYFDTIQTIMSNLENICITDEQKHHCKHIYATMCLEKQLYYQGYNYIHTINYITGHNVSHQTMSFFNKGDSDKTLLLYDGGGMGDHIMNSRFIPEVCSTYMDNTVIFMVNDRLEWLFKQWFKSIPNLHIISYKDNTHNCMKFDYHCSLLSLLKHLNHTYTTLYLPTFYKDIPITSRSECDLIIRSLQKKTYILNWKGNPINTHEHNRAMDLRNAIPLFELPNIQFLVIAKDVTEEERILLKQYNIRYIGNTIDRYDAFYDTIPILKHVEGVISTDTSLPHLSLSLGIKTYVLLSTGCEWRWGDDDITNWYPEAKLIRQKEFGNWTYPIQTLIEVLNKDTPN